jgi:hypothetical protein
MTRCAMCDGGVNITVAQCPAWYIVRLFCSWACLELWGVAFGWRN